MTPARRALIKKLRAFAPLLAFACVATTLLLCVLITKVSDRFTGGLVWPYVSDMSRDSPASSFCGLGFFFSSVLLAAAWGFNYQLQEAVLTEPMDDAGMLPQTAQRLLRTNLSCGMVSCLGLMVMGFVTTSASNAVHTFALSWFVLLHGLAVMINTFVSFQIQKFIGSMTDPLAYTLNGVNLMPPTPEILRLRKLQKTFHIQCVLAGMFAFAMVVYGPVCLTLSSNERLTIAECVTKDLGDEYCNRTMSFDAVYTKLWSYEHDLTVHQLRAVAQLICFLTLVGYSLSFMNHSYGEELEKAAGRAHAQSTHFYSLAIVSTPPSST